MNLPERIANSDANLSFLIGTHQEAINDLKQNIGTLEKIVSKSTNSVVVRLTLTESQVKNITEQLAQYDTSKETWSQIKYSSRMSLLGAIVGSSLLTGLGAYLISIFF